MDKFVLVSDDESVQKGSDTPFWEEFLGDEVGELKGTNQERFDRFVGETT